MKLLKNKAIKYVFALLAGLMVFAVSACGEANSPNQKAEAAASSHEAAAQAVNHTDGNGHVLIVYFSHTGTTKRYAEYLHGIVGGDLIELEPEKAYPAGYSAALAPSKKEQLTNARPALKTTFSDFDSYDTVYLGYPIWWGTVPMVVNTFLESYDFTGKTVIPFATSGGSGISRSVDDIQSEIPKASVKEGLLITNQDDIIPWLERLGQYPVK